MNTKMDMSGMMGNVGNKLMDRFFRKVDGVVWDLFTGKLGIKTNEGIVTIEGTGDDAQVSINMFDQFGMALPAFAQNTSLDAVNVGDLIYGDKRPIGWVVEVTTGTTLGAPTKKFVIMTPDGTRKSWVPPKLNMLGFESGVMVLRSLMNMLPGGASGLTGMQGMLMPMLMMGGELDLDSIMPMMLFSQMGGMGAAPTDPAAPVAANPMANMLPMMMMMQMMKGGKGSKGGGFFE